ncbi:hypothetical protein [Corynebacterium kozikiae]|uniref:hypothetical protein n=1 Tax=Corynebacterium kozikiae TaxID=2968469 RepID=UPI00211C43C2|nr:hypothetical protein [Corynebacterium sp. 76QC2CO]MCQ9343068.1 hypothetical protein [Corynebacterium sp. 76QC2CO]
MVQESSRTAQRASSILEVLGADRMNPYLAEVEGHPVRALELYEWNAELSASFWPLISLTEVSLRNKFDLHLGHWSHENGGDREWLLKIDKAPQDLKDVFRGRAEHFCRRAHVAKKVRDGGTGLFNAPHRRQNVPLTNGDVLSQITLGEWLNFIPASPRVLDDGSQKPFPDATTASRRERLWKDVVSQVFPECERPYEISATLHRVKLFRNRIARHEPIFMLEYRRYRNEFLRLLRKVSPLVHEIYTPVWCTDSGGALIRCEKFHSCC